MCRIYDTPRRLVRHLFVFVLGSVLLEGSGSTTTICHYQEEGVTKPCELFHRVECQNIASKPSNYVEYNEDTWRDEEDGQLYRNITIRMWRTEGYLRVKEIGVEEMYKCWKYKVGSTPYPEEKISMYVDFIPSKSYNDTIFFTVGEQCDYLQNTTYSLQPFSYIEKKVELKLTAVSGIRQVKLVLLGGECEVNCDGSKNNCTVYTQSKTIRDFSETHHFTNLTHRYYCIRVSHGDCRFHTDTVKLEDPPPPPTPIPHEESILTVIMTVVGVAVALVGAGLLFVKKLRRNGTFQRQRVDTDDKDAVTQWQCIQQQWVNSPVCQKVLLLYSRDSAPFCEVVQAFRHLLQSFGNLKVLDSMEQNQMEQVSQGISSWVTQHLDSPDVKVVLIISEGAMIRQNALLKNRIVQIKEPHFLDPVFTQALRQMHENTQLGSDYRRIFPVRFEDFTGSEVSLSLITPLKCYVMQKHLGKLIVELRNFNAAAEPGLEDIRNICPQEVDQLECAITNMKSYCANNPYHVKNNFSLVVPSA